MKIQMAKKIQLSPYLHLLSLWVLALLCAFAGEAGAQTYTTGSTPYAFIDSSSHSKIGYNTSPYRFNQSSGCGTAPPTIDDTLTGLIPIGFSFKYGSTSYTSVYVMSNGRVQFGNTTCGSGTANIGPPQTYPYAYPDSGMNNTMKVFGVDLDSTNLVDVPNYPSSSRKTPCLSIATCYVSVATVGTAPARQFVVTWKSVPEWVTASNTSGSFDLQVILNEDGTFVYQYGTVSHGGTGTAQIGWQLSSTDYQVLNFGAAAEPSANSAIKFFLPAPLAVYAFDEGAWAPGVAGQVVDSSTSARSGSAVGNAQTTSSGKVCRGADIPNNTDAATVDAIKTGINLSNTALSLQGTGTATFWYRSNLPWSGSTAQSAQLLDASGANGEWFFVSKTAAGVLVFEVKDSTGVVRTVSSAAQSFAASTWVHIAVTWNFNGSAGSNLDALQVIVNSGTPTTSAFTSSGTVTTQAGFLYVGDNPLGVADTLGSVNSANGQMDEVEVFNYVLTQSQVNTEMNKTHTCAVFVIDHLEIQHTNGSGLTCTPSTLTIRACKDAACSALYTGGISGTLSAGSGATANWDGSTGNGAGARFTIPSGSSSITKGLQVTTVGSVLLSMAGLSPPVTATPVSTCNFGSPSCTWTSVDSGFIFDVPDHVSDVLQTVGVKAVKKSDSSLQCTAAFASVTKSVAFSCAYNNPTTGTLSVRVNGSSCSPGGTAVNLAFDATGTASTTFQYADVGKIDMTATHTGSGTSAGLTMVGNDSFVAAPKDFAFSSITAAPIKAGTAFSATVTARNNSGVATPNFGKEASAESVTLTHTKYAPTGTGASSGLLSGNVGTFTAGAATATNLTWSEVGTIDLTATLAPKSGSTGYLNTGSGFVPTGTTGTSGAVGRFIPDHFDTVVTQGCSAGSYSYASQPFTVQITAMNGATIPTKTVNYDGTTALTPSFAKAHTLSDGNALTVGSFSGSTATVNVSAFGLGVATVATPSYAFTSRQTVPSVVKVRTVDADAVSSLRAVAASSVEGTTTVRSGRARLLNAYGSEQLDLPMSLRTEYWNAAGTGWVQNTEDNCTGNTLLGAANAVSVSLSPATLTCVIDTGNPGRSGAGCSATGATTPVDKQFRTGLAMVVGAQSQLKGDMNLWLNKPGTPGTVTVTANVPTWLEYPWVATTVADPSARATFGTFKSPLIYRRENY